MDGWIICRTILTTRVPTIRNCYTTITRHFVKSTTSSRRKMVPYQTSGFKNSARGCWVRSEMLTVMLPDLCLMRLAISKVKWSKYMEFANIPKHYGNSHAKLGHSVTCHPAEVTFPSLPQPTKAGTRFSDPGGMQGWVEICVCVL